MHGVKSRAHLLTAGHLSAEQGAELQEGAQEQRAAERRSGHGGLTAPGRVRRRTAARSRQRFQSFRRKPCLRWRGEGAAAASARISIFPRFIGGNWRRREEKGGGGGRWV